MENIASGVKSLETEAEKIIEEAKAGAHDILLRSRKEAEEILSAEFPLDDARAECDRIVAGAREEAENRVELSKEKTSEISTNANKKIEKIVERIVDIIIGTESA